MAPIFILVRDAARSNVLASEAKADCTFGLELPA